MEGTKRDAALALRNLTSRAVVVTWVISYARPDSHRPLHAAPAPPGACLHGRGRDNARAGHWRHYRHLYAHPRSDAAVAAGLRSLAALSHWRGRQLLCPGWPAGSLGDVFVSPLRAAESGGARVRRDHRVPGWFGATERSSRGSREGRQTAPVRVRHRQLLLDARSAGVRRARVHAFRRQAVVAACRCAEPSRLAEWVCLRPLARRIDARDQWTSVHGHRDRSAGILRRHAARRSTGALAAAAAGAADQRRQFAAAATGLGVAARHRTAQAGRDDRRHVAAA